MSVCLCVTVLSLCKHLSLCDSTGIIPMEVKLHTTELRIVAL